MADISKVKLPDNVTYNLKDSGAVRKSGGTMTGNINFPAGKSIYSKDSANRNYALIYDNGNNLWIGATSSNGNHHTGSEGSTYISAGYNTTNSKGNNTIYVSVPTLTGSTWGNTAYAVLHVGNTSFTRSLSSGTKIGTIKINGTSTDLYCQTNTNTHRPIQVDGTEVLGNNTTALNLKAGSNVSITNSSGTVTIAATNTNNAVTQTIDNNSYKDFRILMSATASDETLIEGTRKTTSLRYNPYDQQLQLLADSSSREDVFEVLYKSPDGVGYIVSARIDADGSAAFNGLNLGGSIIPGSTSYHLGSESSKWGDLYVTSIRGGTAYNTQYNDSTTNTTGFCMHGRTNGNKYSCIWSSSKLNFYVDTTNVGNVSDRQLKSEIDEIDPKLLEAIAECKIYQYKAFNRDGLISVGIMAQDLVEKCEEKGVRPENYELLTKMNFIQGDDTLYYSVDYNQYTTFMIDYLQKKVKELEARI